ncbi:hypothetical protein PROFUN_03362 [Planoprotostelium fungivorum]|uniref:OTU domain-containing protein n=1 Tax=Planoprotostelium fungivorum TaxID=1890364 RepID=A0A2P6NWB9_9EUKA|nr:hypothetical protein PROFUN_03362 [Planoprotostelium fungivorum]
MSGENYRPRQRIATISAQRNGRNVVPELGELRAEEYLRSAGLIRMQVPKDGSCMFRAFSHALFLSQRHYASLRAACVQYIDLNRDFFQPFIESYDFDVESYLIAMSRDTQWGGNIEVQALSMLLGRNVAIYSLGQDRPSIVDNNFHNKPQVKLWHADGEHFDVLYNEKEVETMTFCQGIVFELFDKLFGGTTQQKTGEFIDFETKKWTLMREDQEKRDAEFAQKIEEECNNQDSIEAERKKREEEDAAMARILAEEWSKPALRKRPNWADRNVTTDDLAVLRGGDSVEISSGIHKSVSTDGNLGRLVAQAREEKEKMNVEIRARTSASAPTPSMEKKGPYHTIPLEARDALQLKALVVKEREELRREEERRLEEKRLEEKKEEKEEKKKEEKEKKEVKKREGEEGKKGKVAKEKGTDETGEKMTTMRRMFSKMKRK